MLDTVCVRLWLEGSIPTDSPAKFRVSRDVLLSTEDSVNVHVANIKSAAVALLDDYDLRLRESPVEVLVTYARNYADTYETATSVARVGGIDYSQNFVQTPTLTCVVVLAGYERLPYTVPVGLRTVRPASEGVEYASVRKEFTRRYVTHIPHCTSTAELNRAQRGYEGAKRICSLLRAYLCDASTQLRDGAATLTFGGKIRWVWKI